MRAPVYHTPKLIPRPQVSFNISIVQKVDIYRKEPEPVVVPPGQANDLNKEKKEEVKKEEPKEKPPEKIKILI